MSDLIKVAEWSAQPRANVVFVHGLDGHPYDTWRRGKSEPSTDPTFWPQWLAEDIEGINVFTLGYAASASGWKAEDMPMEDRVSNVAARLLAVPELHSRPMTIICHSLGGLIVKQVLLQLNEQKAIDEKSANLLSCVRQVVFLATPHSGATGATWMDRLRLLIWPSALTVALVAEAATLRRINNSYKTLAFERGGALKHLVFFETQSTILGKIVKEGAADPGLECKAIPLEANHFTIVKPRDRRSQAYDEIRTLVGEHPAAGNSGELVRNKLPPYAPERSFDLLGKALRVAALLLVAATVYLAASAVLETFRPARRIMDDLTMAVVLAAIPDDDKRIHAATLIYGRGLTNHEIVLVREIRGSFDPPPVISPQAEIKIRNAKTAEDLQRILSSISLEPCEGSFAFRIEGALLVCLNGQRVPALRAANVGPLLQSRDALVFHYTGGGTTEGLLRFFSSSDARASVHILIAHSGAVVQLVPFDRQAQHAGVGQWKERGITNLNAHSIGIMLSNIGQLTKNQDGTFSGLGLGSIPSNRVTTILEGGAETYWESYRSEQISSAKGIVSAFRSQQSDIGILRHSDISPTKTDPGPAFPIAKLR